MFVNVAGTDDFSVWYGSEYTRMVAALTALTGDGELARDVAGEAFARALARWERVRIMDSPAGWTYRVAVNLLRRRHRRSLRERELHRALARDDPASVDQDSRLDLVAALGRLSPRARLAVVLRYVADLTEADVAAVMGVAPGTVASTLSTARARLAAALREPQCGPGVKR